MILTTNVKENVDDDGPLDHWIIDGDSDESIQKTGLFLFKESFDNTGPFQRSCFIIKSSAALAKIQNTCPCFTLYTCPCFTLFYHQTKHDPLQEYKILQICPEAITALSGCHSKVKAWNHTFIQYRHSSK